MNALLSTGAAQYLANVLTHSFSLATMSGFAIFAVLSAFLILIHLGFASTTALTASLMPVMLGVLASVPGINAPGIGILLTITGYLLLLLFALTWWPMLGLSDNWSMLQIIPSTLGIMSRFQ